MMFSFFDYIPTRIKNVSQRDWQIRRLIWDFKDGKSFAQVAQLTAQKIMQLYGSAAKDVVFACVPASSAAKNEKRYKQFAAMVCRLTGAVDAYQHIKVEGERLAIHESHKNGKKINSVEVIDFDKNFFKGKKVLVFDDILTRGFSYAKFANELEKFGAEVLGGLFIGRTAEV